MTQFQYLDGGNVESQDKLAEGYLFEQVSEGIAKTGVISGLGVAQTPTASGSVVVGAGAGLVQPSRLNGADRLVSDTDETLDILTANPVGGLPRNDIVVFDQATLPNAVRVIVGTPNATPTDPTVPATAIPLARLSHAASATTVPAAKITDLRSFVNLRGAVSSAFGVNGKSIPASSASKAGKRVHWGKATITPNSTGYANITHGAGFTPTIITATSEFAYAVGVDPSLITGTAFQVRLLNPITDVAVTTATTVMFFCGE